MRIHEFRLKLGSRGEQSVLFQALRKLTLLEDPQRTLASADDGDGGADGWVVWNEPPSSEGGSLSLRLKVEAA